MHACMHVCVLSRIHVDTGGTIKIPGSGLGDSDRVLRGSSTGVAWLTAGSYCIGMQCPPHLSHGVDTVACTPIDESPEDRNLNYSHI